jgi:hypothetical protein
LLADYNSPKLLLEAIPDGCYARTARS